MNETKQIHVTDTLYLRSNRMRLGTGCAHATVCKTNKEINRQKELKKDDKTDSQNSKMAVLAKLGYKKGKS